MRHRTGELGGWPSSAMVPCWWLKVRSNFKGWYKINFSSPFSSLSLSFPLAAFILFVFLPPSPLRLPTTHSKPEPHISRPSHIFFFLFCLPPNKLSSVSSLDLKPLDVFETISLVLVWGFPCQGDTHCPPPPPHCLPTPFCFSSAPGQLDHTNFFSFFFLPSHCDSVWYTFNLFLFHLSPPIFRSHSFFTFLFISNLEGFQTIFFWEQKRKTNRPLFLDRTPSTLELNLSSTHTHNHPPTYTRSQSLARSLKEGTKGNLLNKKQTLPPECSHLNCNAWFLRSSMPI